MQEHRSKILAVRLAIFVDLCFLNSLNYFPRLHCCAKCTLVDKTKFS